ncbi:MAG TPA: TolC family protein [Polyangiaceae bacterium]|nr:TolC family protein [Polyangiaceae bacterium]
MKTKRTMSVVGAAVCALLPRLVFAQPAPAAPPPRAPGAAAPGAAAPAAAAPAVPAPGVLVPAGAAPPGAGSAPAGSPDRPLPDRAAPAIEGVEVEPGGLTAAEVARRALAVSPSVKEKRAQLEGADEKINETMAQFFPKLTLLASYTRLSPVTSSFGSGSLVAATKPGPVAPGDTLVGVPLTIPTVQNNYSVGGRLSIPLSDYVLRISDAAASSKAGKEAARLNVEAQKLKVDSDARVLYFNWLRARAQSSIAQKSVEQTRARLGDARASFEVGAISKAELLRIEALVANTEIVLHRSESMQLLTTGQLAIVMEDWHPDYHVGEGIPLPESIPDESEPLDHLVASAQQRRLEVRAVDEAIRGYRRGSGATRAGAYPRLDAVGDVTLGNPNPRYFPPTQDWHTTWSAGLQASWTVGDAFIQGAAARELEQQAAQAEQQKRELKAGIANEVLMAYLDLNQARIVLEKQQTALAAAQEAYRVTTDLFRAGRATGTDLIDSESGLLNAKLGELNARIDLTIASLTLRHASGRDVPDAAVAKN